MKRYICLIITSLFTINNFANVHEIDSIFHELDKAIEHSAMYIEVKEKRIADYKQKLSFPDITFEQSYKLNKLLLEEYRPFICDSAIYYAKQCVKIAEEHDIKDWMYESYLTMAQLYSLQFLFISYDSLTVILGKFNCSL